MDIRDARTRAEVEAAVKDTLAVEGIPTAYVDQSVDLAWASGRAHVYAPFNGHLLTADPWIRTMVYERADTTKHKPANALDLLVLRMPYIVPSAEANVYRREFREVPPGGKYRRRFTREWYFAHPLPADRGPLQKPKNDWCERCGFDARLADDKSRKKPVSPVHIAHKNVIVEIMLCHHCVRSLGKQTGIAVMIAEPRPRRG